MIRTGLLLPLLNRYDGNNTESCEYGGKVWESNPPGTL